MPQALIPPNAEDNNNNGSSPRYPIAMRQETPRSLALEAKERKGS